MSLTKYTELYTATVARRLCRALQCSCHVKEAAFGYRSSFGFVTDGASDDPEPKRRRLAGKFHPEHLYIDPTASVNSQDPSAVSETPQRSRPSDSLAQVQSLIQIAERCAPRVGKVLIKDGPLFDAVRDFYPDKEIKVIDVCRGVDRLRILKNEGKGFAPLRRAFGKRRSDLEVFHDAGWEEWESLSRRQQTRNGTPSRLLVTVFATKKRMPEHDVPAPVAKHQRTDEPDETVDESPPMIVPDMPESIPASIRQTPMSTEAMDTTAINPSIKTSHGPLFQKLPLTTQNQIRKIHQNLGHPDARVLQMALKRHGWSSEDVRGSADFVCPTCVEQQQPKIARPGKLKAPTDFNDHISFDGAEWKDPHGNTYGFYHFVDTATNFHVAAPFRQRTTEGLIEAFSTAWLRWAGPPKSIMFDSATEANSEQFAQFLQQHSIQSYVIPTDAHWQLGRAERHGAIVMHMLDKYNSDQPISNFQEFEQGLIQVCNAKNSMSRHEGFTPELWVLGKMRALPGNNTDLYLDSASYLGLDENSPEGLRFNAMMAKREAARVAFIRAEHSVALRKALNARSRPDRIKCRPGDLVMYWKSGKGVEPGAWHGPAKVLMVEGSNLIWISHLTRLFRCAPGHVKCLSDDEERSVSDLDRSLFQLPERSGSGVFQFRELSQQDPPEVNLPHANIPPPVEPEIIINNPPPNSPNNPIDDDNHPGSEIQPDAEPMIPPTPHHVDPLQEAIETPVPPEDEEGLMLQNDLEDHWEIKGQSLIRHHRQPRLRVFFPHESCKCPVALEDIEEGRCTQGTFLSGTPFVRNDMWKNNVGSHLPQPEPWTGSTTFTLHEQYKVLNQPETFHTTSQNLEHQVFHAEILLSMDDINKCLGRTYDYQETFLASAAKRQKVEVKLRDLSPEDAKLFAKAKDKELESWLATDTVRKILRNQVPEGQLLRSRWVLTWKNLDEVEQKELGVSRKAKARLVILGYEDPLIDVLPRDSPTLGRDTRMLALQCIASHQWTARSFDIRTAFLRGSRQDDRILGVEPPAELRAKMQLRSSEVCELLKGAYGLINAPLLWYVELKTALISLGFVISPLDPCLFVLPKAQNTAGEPSHIHGILGIHVDDGVGGGDATFTEAIRNLEKRFPFGSQRTGTFTFTGVQIQQSHNGDITINQTDYINDIPPININRERRKQPELPINKDELQSLRGLIGSLQYAATNTRPDLSCRLSLLQAKVTCATVADLMTGNRILNDAKKHSSTAIRIQSLFLYPLIKFGFCLSLMLHSLREKRPTHRKDV
eukprot:s5108_g1.t1